ncbi:hypothetical protein WEI85_41185 [Actinomycetes bacterium KLBMP 9797]
MVPLQQFVFVLPQSRASAGAVTVRREAESLAEAIPPAVRDLEAVGLRPYRIEADDWVTLAEIGARIGRSREIVRLWATGRYGPGGFPPPLNPGRDTSFYSWTEVAQWLRQRMGQHVPDDQPTLVAMNLALQLRRVASRVERMDLVRSLIPE